MGAVIFLVMGFYLLLSLVVVAVTVKRADTENEIRAGFIAALVMFLIPFWDWLPTVAAHKYYCEKEAGFWVYQTLDQWKAENPGVMEGLVKKSSTETTPNGDLQTLDERFAVETHRNTPIPFLPTSITDRRLVDRKTGAVLAKGVDVGSGVGYMATGGGFKFWLNQEPCVAESIWKVTAEIDAMRGKK